MTSQTPAEEAPFQRALDAGDLDTLRRLLNESDAALQQVFRDKAGPAAAIAARERVRRAERFLGLGIRRAQHAGTIETLRESQQRVLMEARGIEAPSSKKVKAAEVIPHATKFYPMADVPVEVFEQAIATCRGRGRMGREDVLRELRRITAEIDAARPPEMRKRRTVDVNQVLESVIGASGVSETVEASLDWTGVDLSRAPEFIDGLREAIRSLGRLEGRLKRRLKNPAGNTR